MRSYSFINQLIFTFQIGLFAGMAFVYGWPLLFPPSRLNYSFHAQSATPFIPGVDLTTIPFYSSSHLLGNQIQDVSHVLPPERNSTLIDFTDIESTLSPHSSPPTAASVAPRSNPTKSTKPTTHPTTAVSPVPLAHMCFLRHAAQYVVPNIIQLVLAVALVVGSLHLRHLPDNFRETRIIFVLALVQLVLSSLFAPVYFLARTVDTVYVSLTKRGNTTYVHAIITHSNLYRSESENHTLYFILFYSIVRMYVLSSAIFFERIIFNINDVQSV